MICKGYVKTNNEFLNLTVLSNLHHIIYLDTNNLCLHSQMKYLME